MSAIKKNKGIISCDGDEQFEDKDHTEPLCHRGPTYLGGFGPRWPKGSGLQRYMNRMKQEVL